MLRTAGPMARRRNETAPGYAIRLVAELTGLGVETLRQWERRYGFPTPERNASGARVYDAETVETLKLIARALEHGYRPGDLVGRPRQEIERALVAFVEPSEEDAAVQEVVDALAKDDAGAVAALLRRAALVHGPRRFVTAHAEHLVRRVGELWASGELDVRQEHLLSDMLTTQLRIQRAAFDDVRGSPIVVLATLPDEHHALGLEMVAVYLASGGATVRVLGPDTPPDQIVTAARAHQASIIGISISESSQPAAAREGVRAVLAHLPPRTVVFAGGEGARSLSIDHAALRVILDWDALDAAIEQA